MRDETIWCDLCKMAGQRRKKAVAQYWDTANERWDICRKCLKLIKEASLEYEMFISEGAQDEA